jgi:hypothetical protein
MLEHVRSIFRPFYDCFDFESQFTRLKITAMYSLFTVRFGAFISPASCCQCDQKCFCFAENDPDVPKRSYIEHSFEKIAKKYILSTAANPTIASYNASVVKIYSAVNSMARF